MRKRRYGFTLVEMLVIISLLAMIMGMCLVTLRAVSMRERSSRDLRAEAIAIDRLGDRFRRDVWAANRLEPAAEFVPGSSDRLVLIGPAGQRAEYRATGGRLEISWSAATPTPPRVETFKLRSWKSIRFSSELRPEGVLVVLGWRSSTSGSASARDGRFEARLDRDRRFGSTLENP